MKNNIKLFIQGKEVEFNKDPKILLNYTEKDLHNPTIVKNSFSKSITIEGTQRNNDIFGHIWDLTRVQSNLNLNPIKKTDFQLFVNGELFEKGYAKLDKVTRTNNSVQYSITLFGGLGQFFYNLSYDQDDASNAKKTLASLKYHDEWSVEPDLDFVIDKDAVYEAWGQLCGWGSTTNDRWDVINFAPCYNGIPNDFDATKILINNNGLQAGFSKGVTIDNVTYRPVYNGSLNQNGYSLGEMPHDLTEWETRDLRSWLQRPVISMQKIIEACRQPENNGGFEVKLDDHFFHTFNPYYYDSWVTLPLLKDLDGVGGGETEEVTGATLSRGSGAPYCNKLYNVNFNTSSLSSYNNVELLLEADFIKDPESIGAANELYLARTYESTGGVTLQGSRYVKKFEYSCGIVVQLLAFSQTGEVVGQSKAYLLGTEKNHAHKDTPLWNDFYKSDGDFGVEPEYEFIQGKFKMKLDGTYQFVDMNDNPVYIKFTFSSPTDFASLKVKVKTPYNQYTKYKFSGSDSHPFTADHTGYWIDVYNERTKKRSGNYTQGQVASLDRIQGDISFSVKEMTAIATDYEGLFSGTKITKEKLLTTDKTPADYLISYCKMLGLYFYHDSTEESDDPERYPAGVVHIMDRDTFYTEDVVDLEKMIDWNKKVEIVPALAASKWYRFNVEHIESQAETEYSEQYGQQYGSQLLNTNYNFDSNTTDLYDGNAFKSGVMVLEKDKYFKRLLTQDLPNYITNGLTYSLFARESSSEEFQTTELDYPQITNLIQYDINPDYKGFDAFPKLQAHTEDNSASDGSGVLLFFRGVASTDTSSGSTKYNITDDVPDMIYLNDATPCWILTYRETDAGGNRIAYQVSNLPYFTRDLVFVGKYGNIVHSWNFGHPQVIFSPDTYTTDGDSIYDVCWKKYVRDLYNVDTRKLVCYVRAEMDGKPWPYWLRRFYWFQNSIWVLNSIKDMDMGSYDTTKMEFIKVQDMENYKLDKIEYQGQNQIIIDQDTIPCSGGTVTGRVILQGGGGWFASDIIGGEDEDGNRYYMPSDDVMVPRSGHGEVTEFEITVSASTAATPITWTVSFEDDLDKWYRDSFVQESCGTPPGPEPPTPTSSLEIVPASSTVSYSSGTTTLTVNSSNVSGISVSSSAAWAVPTLNGNTVTVQYEENLSATRTATITVTGTGVSGTISDSAQLEQSAYNPPTPTSSYVTYNLTSNLGNNEVDLTIEITSKDGMTDSATAYCTQEMGDSQDIDVYLESVGDTQITIDIDVIGVVHTDVGDLIIRATYGQIDTGYQYVNYGNVISITTNFLENTPLIIEVVSTSQQNNRAATVQEEEEPEVDE